MAQNTATFDVTLKMNEEVSAAFKEMADRIERLELIVDHFIGDPAPHTMRIREELREDCDKVRDKLLKERL